MNWKMVRVCNASAQFQCKHISLSSSFQDFGADITLRQIWTDHRLAFASDIDVVESIGVPDHYYSGIWLPDTYIVNGKKSELHHVTMENKMFRVYKNGTVIYSQRYVILKNQLDTPGLALITNCKMLYMYVLWINSISFHLKCDAISNEVVGTIRLWGWLNLLCCGICHLFFMFDIAMTLSVEYVNMPCNHSLYNENYPSYKNII